MREPESNGLASSDLPLTALPLATLLAGLKQQDEEQSIATLAEIVRRFEAVVRRGWRLTRNVEYQEFGNEVFKRALGALDSLREPLAFPAFFRNVVRSVAGDLMRQEMKSPESLETVGELVRAVDEEITVPLIVRSYLEHLKDRERMVLELEYIDGYTTLEIARQLGIQPGAVRVLRSRALKKLRDVADRDRRLLERLQES